MEGKKYRTLGQDCGAVSEVMGAVLMISIVVLAFSSVALTIFSEGDSMDPPHTPHTNLRENINTSEDTVEIFHNGGEEIDLKDIMIILNTGEKRAEFNMSESAVKVFDPKGNQLPSDGVFALGNRIVIDPTGKINITSGNAVDLYFVHTASDQVIQKTKLWKDVRDLPYWITPHTFPAGTAYDNSTEKWLDTELVDKIDNRPTESFIPKNIAICQNYTFGIDVEELSIPESTSFTKVILKIISTRHDQSPQIRMVPEIYNGSEWTTFNPIPFEGSNKYVETNLTITKYVKNITELENLEVRILAEGNAANQSKKTFWVDFVGVHVEY
ncbi:type IV pilin N-terminal domain-containing protein [Methanosarcina mazei]|uniref:type IV pilin N-terminal domain-containing protein n=1 Tax=Methanosarcina mazei TaxID=2209 RepID=UPI0025574812|nr:type IV pilin N-terminal domain-containing protein [Methanosarcina mazei]WIM48175.1 type IV pilin N-terminal domain-containing protein [Methanosarcina mazei]